MSMNPMQKKARVSFLLGALITTIIFSIVILLLLMKMKSLQAVKASATSNVYVVVSDIKSGESLQGKAIIKQVESTAVPANSITDANSGRYINDKTVAKINLASGTVVTSEMISNSSESNGNDVRIQEYNMIVLPSRLEVGDFLDIRLRLPNGEDYIVISKKEVKQASEDTIWLKVTEDEILTMSNAIVEAYIMKGSKLYATTYTEAGNQTKSTPTYPVSYEVLKLIETNPNIVTAARNELYNRYNASQRNDYISKALNGYSDTAITNIESQISDAVARQQEARKAYLNSLQSAAIY